MFIVPAAPVDGLGRIQEFKFRYEIPFIYRSFRNAFFHPHAPSELRRAHIRDETYFVHQIDFVNAPGGAGKTYGATDDMKARVVRGEKIILVQLINRLICETVETTFTRLGIDPSHVTEISERTRPKGAITKAVIDHINNAVEGRGEILVITHAAFVRLAEMYASFRDGWTLIIDEALDVQEAFSFKLPDTHAFVTNHLEITRSTDPSY